MPAAPTLRETVDHVARLLAAGDLEGAAGHVQGLASTQPAGYALGFTALALARRDGATALEHARRAIAAGAGALGEQYLALAHLQAGEVDPAIDAARRAVALDASPRARAGLGTVLLAAGRPGEAAGVLREVLAEAPAEVEALSNLATACAQLGDHAEAIRCYARAFEVDPGNPRVLGGLLGLFADAGKWLGAHAVLELSRRSGPPPEVELVYDVARLHLARLIADRFPAPGVAPDADRAVTDALARAEGKPPRIRLAVGRTLVELGRIDAARPLLDALAQASLEPADRAALAFLQGACARAAGDKAAALAHFDDALAADPGHADACAAALRMLLEDSRPGALEDAAALVEAFPADRATPELLYFEAAYHGRAGRPEAARVRLERVLRITGGAGPIAQRARAALGQRGAV